MLKNCPDGKILNPLTNRCISKNGILHKSLIKNNHIQTETKICPDSKVLNPLSKRCIKIGTALYKSLVKNKVIVEGDRKPQVVYKTDVKKDNLRCVNTTTFMMFEDVHNIPNTDLLRTPDGYCFSSTELVAFIQSSGFNNINPHDQNKKLFDENNIEKLLKEHPVLLKKLKKYFNDLKKQQNEDIGVYKETINILYQICDVGRICYFNLLTSHNQINSATFNKSIEALQKLSENINKLNNIQKKSYEFVINKLNDVNKGATCIHAVGFSFINYFIDKFSKIKNVTYDISKTNMYFIKKGSYVVFYSYEHRMSLYEKGGTSSHHKRWYDLLKNNKSEIIMKDRTAKSKTFKEKCNFEPYLVTLNSSDEWHEISDWRKVIFDDYSCFDILFLVKTITDNLNNAKNNNPYPKFPMNPFTQKDFVEKELKTIKWLLEDNFVKINEPLKVFLNSPELWKNSNTWKNKMIDKYESVPLRFVRYNNIIDDALHCNGAWNFNTYPTTRTERLIISYLNNGRQTILDELKKIKTEVISNSYYLKIIENIFSANSSKNFVIENI